MTVKNAATPPDLFLGFFPPTFLKKFSKKFTQ